MKKATVKKKCLKIKKIQFFFIIFHNRHGNFVNAFLACFKISNTTYTCHSLQILIIYTGLEMVSSSELETTKATDSILEICLMKDFYQTVFLNCTSSNRYQQKHIRILLYNNLPPATMEISYHTNSWVYLL